MEDAWPQRAAGTLDSHTVASLSKAQKDIVDVEATILEGRHFETNRSPKRIQTAH